MVAFQSISSYVTYYVMYGSFPVY